MGINVYQQKWKFVEPKSNQPQAIMFTLENSSKFFCLQMG
jgi:hypothetical protein